MSINIRNIFKKRKTSSVTTTETIPEDHIYTMPEGTGAAEAEVNDEEYEVQTTFNTESIEEMNDDEDCIVDVEEEGE